MIGPPSSILAGWVRNRKLVTTPKLPPPPRKRPQEVTVLAFAGGHEAAVGQHHVGLDEVVAGQAILARKVAVPAAKGQAGDVRWSR